MTTLVTYMNGCTEEFPDPALVVKRTNGPPCAVSALVPGDMRLNVILGPSEVVSVEEV